VWNTLWVGLSVVAITLLLGLVFNLFLDRFISGFTMGAVKG
jgi:hypothetical protein